MKSKCLCEPGYFGDSCEHASLETSCKNNCNSNGICSLGKCFCYHGFKGQNCEEKKEFNCKSGPVTTSNKLKSNSLANLTPCTGNGLCDLGKCICYAGFKGPYCESKFICPNDCSGKGICVEDGKCNCKQGYNDSDCSNKSQELKSSFLEIEDDVLQKNFNNLSNFRNQTLILKSFNSTEANKVDRKEEFKKNNIYEYIVSSILILLILLSLLIDKGEENS